jgi:hypothetical protein
MSAGHLPLSKADRLVFVTNGRIFPAHFFCSTVFYLDDLAQSC